MQRRTAPVHSFKSLSVSFPRLFGVICRVGRLGEAEKDAFEGKLAGRGINPRHIGPRSGPQPSPSHTAGHFVWMVKNESPYAEKRSKGQISVPIPRFQRSKEGYIEIHQKH